MGRRYYTVRSGMLAPPFRETRCMADPYRPLRVPLHDTVLTRGLRQHLTRWPGEDPEPLVPAARLDGYRRHVPVPGGRDAGPAHVHRARLARLRPQRVACGRLLVSGLLRRPRRAARSVRAGRARHADRPQHGRQHRDVVCRDPPRARAPRGLHRGIRARAHAPRAGAGALPGMAATAARAAGVRELPIRRGLRPLPRASQSRA